LRALSTREVFEIYQEARRFGFPTVIDGYFIPKPSLRSSGPVNRPRFRSYWDGIPRDPGMALCRARLIPDNFITKVKAVFPDDAEQILKHYPHQTEKEVEYSATSLASDRFIAYSTWKWFDLHRKHSNQPVYRYLYSKLRPPLVESPQSGPGGEPPK
jgi:para-nitrobenzyl esterase